MKRYAHVQTEIQADREYLQLIINKYKVEGYQIRKINNPIIEKDCLEYEIQLSDDCIMNFHESFYIDKENVRHPLILQVIYKLK